MLSPRAERAWCDDPNRRAEAAIDSAVRFATKPALGLWMLDCALKAGLPARWVTADEAYGLDSKFRTWSQQQQIGYVLEVPRSQRIPTAFGNWHHDLLATAAPVDA